MWDKNRGPDAHMTLHIPESLSRNKEWAQWIAQLPDIVAACAKKWALQIEAPMAEDDAQMSYSYIIPATRSDGAEVILKESPGLTHIGCFPGCDHGTSTGFVVAYQADLRESCIAKQAHVCLWTQRDIVIPARPVRVGKFCDLAAESAEAISFTFP